MKQRLCIGCGQADDHPRHVIQGQQPWHMDCHAAATGCATCTRQLDGAQGVTGDELRTHLLSLRTKEA